MEKVFPADYVQPTAEAVNINAAVEQREMTDEEFEAALPIPCGHKILLALPQAERNFKGTVIEKVESTIAAETVTSVVALVLGMGPSAYMDKERFPDGAWCKVGDYVLLRPYQGTRFLTGGKEFRIVNDDTIDGVVADPTSYRRI